jgi:hypothetical protein
MRKLRILKAKLEFIKNKFMDIDNATLKQHPEDQDEIWNMYEQSYKSIGMHLDRNKLLSKYDDWALQDVDEDPYADLFITFTDTPHGKKLGVAGNDGGAEAKNAIKNAIGKYLTKPGYYAELSLTLEYIAQKRGVPFIDNEELVTEVLGGKAIEWEGDGYYSRQLGEMGKVSKRLYGYPKGVDHASLRFKGEVKGH